jgi:DNA-binding NarL/FixJ family response regulator
MVVEDNQFIRSSVAGSLRLAGLDVVLECSTALAAVQGALATMPEVAILDLHLGDGPSGIDIAVGLRRKLPELGIVLLTSFADPRMMSTQLPALPAGTVYLVKQQVADTAEIVAAIHTAQKNIQVSAKTGPKLAKAPLTDAQIEVLRLVADGLANAEIALRRQVSEKAVEQTISRIAKRLGISADSKTNQRAALVRQFFELTGTTRSD